LADELLTVMSSLSSCSLWNSAEAKVEAVQRGENA